MTGLGRISLPARLVHSPGQLLLAIVAGLIIVAAPVEGAVAVARCVVAAVTGSTLVDLGLAWLARGRFVFPEGALISGMIVALVLRPEGQWYVPLVAGALAAGSKYFLRVGPIQIFNPAAVGLLVCGLVFSAGQSWWGALADLPVPWIAVLLVVGGFVTQRVRRAPVVLAFLGCYFGLFTLAALLPFFDAARGAEAFRVPFVNAAIFCATFMLTDPVTSPSRPHDQVPAGGLAAITSALTFLAFPQLPHLLCGLLAANAWNAWRRAQREEAATRPGANDDRVSAM